VEGKGQRVGVDKDPRVGVGKGQRLVEGRVSDLH
jgi:hypothetical protein